MVEIEGDGLEHAMTALNGVGIPTIGPAFTWFGNEAPHVGRRMTAVPDVKTRSEAADRVKEAIEGDYAIRVLTLYEAAIKGTVPTDEEGARLRAAGITVRQIPTDEPGFRARLYAESPEDARARLRQQLGPQRDVADDPRPV